MKLVTEKVCGNSKEHGCTSQQSKNVYNLPGFLRNYFRCTASLYQQIVQMVEKYSWYCAVQYALSVLFYTIILRTKSMIILK